VTNIPTSIFCITDHLGSVGDDVSLSVCALLANQWSSG
jgi:hypothetical protein